MNIKAKQIVVHKYWEQNPQIIDTERKMRLRWGGDEISESGKIPA